MTEVLMNKKESQPRSPNSNLPLINLNAAGIDIGADRHWVSVPLDRDKDFDYPPR
jgi:transposase